MKFLYNIILFAFVTNTCYSQSSQSKADSLRNNGNLTEAIEYYKASYDSSPKKWRNTYNLACAYALTFEKDSAYYYLNIALKSDSSLWALADSDLYALIDDPRWTEIENVQLERFQKENVKLKQPQYTKKLLNIILKDQVLDYNVKQGRTYYMKNGHIPQWYYPLGSYKEKIAQDNFVTMQQLIKEYGWPKYSNVGQLAADAPLLVINHHKNNEVRKQYLEQIKQSCMQGEGSCIEYAKIQDRILVDENKPQVYGMQFKYNEERNLEPFPIINPEHVDQRRRDIGLEPLKDYLKRKINYDWLVVQE